MPDQTKQHADSTPTEAAPVQIPQNVRNLHNRGLAALERDNLDFAIDIFFKCIELAPAFIAARRNLRLTEVARFKRARPGALTRHITYLRGIPTMLKLKTFLKTGKNQEALLAAERLMQINPLHAVFGRLYADASVAAELPDAGVMTLEIMREHSPTDIDVTEVLGRLYHTIKNYKAARDCLEKVVLLRPNDMEIAALLKNSEALITMHSGWIEAEKEGKGYQAVLADKDQAAQLERTSKAVKTEEDAEMLISEARTKIEAEPLNLNYRMNLGHLLLQQKRFDEAIEVYQEARKVNPADAELDRRLNNAIVAKFDAEIAQLRESGDEEAAISRETERNQHIFDDLSERVQRYPNDLRLRFELGMQYFQYEYFDEAIPQFQLAIRSPKDRIQALRHLALCFRHKNLLDMAAMQLTQALENLPSMTPEKLDIMYELGEIYQDEGNIEEAARLFKEVYRVDVTYRDISKKIEDIYAAEKNASAGN